MTENKAIPELFLEATNAYKDWWICGRDFVNHHEIFEAWLKAIDSYYKAAGVSRQYAIDQIRASLGMSDAR